MLRLKGLPVAAVAWNKAAVSEAAMRECVVGTAAGSLYELEMHERDKREKVRRLIRRASEWCASVVGVQALCVHFRITV